MPQTMRPELEPLPAKWQHARIDPQRGYPVPWFVPWIDENGNELADGEGRPEFRLMSQRKLVEACRHGNCWVCGGRLGRYRAFTIGPMCLVNRINAEPPSHVECAEWSARNCPFLARPHMVRREDGLPERVTETAGIAVMRNPGAMVVYVVDRPAPIKYANGVLFQLPEPVRLTLWAEGRAATLPEIERSFETGLPALLDVCTTDEERQEVMDRGAKALGLAARYIEDPRTDLPV